MTTDMSARVAAATPVTVVTGFLGSGKTTLLNHLLARPGMERTAVVVNEFGEVAIDHLLVRKVDESTVLLNSGCLCCTMRGDLVRALRELYAKRLREDIPAFERVLVETTGLADPAPILHTLFGDRFVSSCFRLDGVVTTVDAVNGPGQLDRQPESVKQAAIADRLLVTKTDLARAEATAALVARLGRLNPAAPVEAVVDGRIEPARLFGAGLFDAARRARAEEWLRAEAYHDHDHGHGAADVNRHDARIAAFCLTYARPLPWARVNAGLERLVAGHGDDLLRVKGILNVEGDERPVVMHGVQHLFHPPLRLPGWPSADRRSRLVLITRDVARATVEAVMRGALGVAAD